MTAVRNVFLLQKGFFAFLLGGLWTLTFSFPPGETTELQDIIDKRLASVVQIQPVKKGNYTFGVKEVEDFFLPENQQKQNGYPSIEDALGSGFIIRSDGYIVTARHLISQVDEVHVILNDGARFKAAVVGSDFRSDVAILKIAAHDLPAISVEAYSEENSKMRIGQLVFAVGSPMSADFRNSVTMGVVSAVQSISLHEQDAFWLTDAVLNKGNSGGPVLDSQGALLGMVGAPSPVENRFWGLGAIVPSARVAQSALKIITSGKNAKAQLGIQYGPAGNVTAHQTGAAQIVKVEPGSSAHEAGLRQGDIILSVNGNALDSHLDLSEVIRDKAPGDVITLTIQRGRDAISMQIRLKPPAPDQPVHHPEETSSDVMMQSLGFLVDNLSLPLMYDMALPVEEGVMVLYVNPSSEAYRESGVRGGMVIVEMAGEQIRNTADFERVFRTWRPGDAVLVRLYRPFAQAPLLTALVKP